MRYYIVIPTYNEEQFIALTLQSLAEQTVVPTKVVVVNDSSTDSTPEIVSDFAKKYPWITLVNKTSDAIHLPGSKVIQAFQKGLESIDEDYDLIVKADSDLIFPFIEAKYQSKNPFVLGTCGEYWCHSYSC